MNHRGPALVNVVISQGSARQATAVPLAQLSCWGQPERRLPGAALPGQAMAAWLRLTAQEIAIDKL